MTEVDTFDINFVCSFVCFWFTGSGVYPTVHARVSEGGGRTVDEISQPQRGSGKCTWNAVKPFWKDPPSPIQGI